MADILAENLGTKVAFEAEPLIKDRQERLLIKGGALSVLTLIPDTLAQARFTAHQCWVAEDGLTIHFVRCLASVLLPGVTAQNLRSASQGGKKIKSGRRGLIAGLIAGTFCDFTVGASMLTKAVCQAQLLLDVLAPSLASPLPQGSL